MTKKEEQELKRQAKLEKERARIETMKVYEKEYESHGWICGIDEVGRGPLCGPVVASAVILPKDCQILYLNDSKKLSEKKREELYDVIMEQAIAVGVGMASPQRIDEINILEATKKCMKNAVESLKISPEMVFVDALTLDVSFPQQSIIKGDAKSYSIGSASIIAKVYRDNLMEEYAKIYPEYGFEKHKGYGTKAHIDAIKENGPCLIHRRTFIKNFWVETGKN